MVECLALAESNGMDAHMRKVWPLAGPSGACCSAG